LNNSNKVNCSNICNIEVNKDLDTQVIRDLSYSFDNKCKFEETVPSGPTIFTELNTLVRIEVILCKFELNLGSLLNAVVAVLGLRPRRNITFTINVHSCTIDIKFINSLIESIIDTVIWVTYKLVIFLITVGDCNFVVEVVTMSFNCSGGISDTNVQKSHISVDNINWGE
jgi:hypothetical protein